MNYFKIRFLEIAFVIAAIVLVGTLTLPSCNNAKPEDTKDVATEHNDAKFDNEKEDDAKFPYVMELLS